ncbi:hypothetical protein FH063_004223 [Azospirillum argentinense]|uniref:Uncharacterized protein n=1 Tax=Azospirillum argentinense TaxID=2970906 RepID=A0A5B0KKW9_9PROT|nr:hypothetical protein FH063_004223 [Azospirillum argentinense]
MSYKGAVWLIEEADQFGVQCGTLYRQARACRLRHGKEAEWGEGNDT